MDRSTTFFRSNLGPFFPVNLIRPRSSCLVRKWFLINLIYLILNDAVLLRRVLAYHGRMGTPFLWINCLMTLVSPLKPQPLCSANFSWWGHKLSEGHRDHSTWLWYEINRHEQFNPTVSINKVQMNPYMKMLTCNLGDIRLHRFLEFFVRVANGNSTHP